VQARRHDPVAACDLVLADATEIQGTALAGTPNLGRLVHHVQSAQPHGFSGRRHHELVAHRDAAGEHGGDAVPVP
jgi:hypothetical protein